MYLAERQRHVHVAFDRITVGDKVELAQLAVQRLLANPLDGTLVDHAVVDQVGDGTDLDVVFGGKGFEFGATGHGAVIVHDFADHATGLETGHTRQIAGCLGMPGAGQRPTGLSHQREDMARADDVIGFGVRGRRGLHGACAVSGRDTGRHTGGRLDRNGELGAKARAVTRRHQWQLEGLAALAGHRHADQPTGKTRHEVDMLGLAAFCGHDQITLVLAIFVIHKNDHLALANVFDQLFNTVERHAAPPFNQDLR